MKSLGLKFTNEELCTIVAVLDASTTSFVTLSTVAGLDPSRDFRGADLRNVDFGADYLAGFDFSGADLTGAKFSHATGLEAIVIDDATRLPDDFLRPPRDFSLDEVRRRILSGEPPPYAWSQFITELDLSGTHLKDLKPLSGLNALKDLNLGRTPVDDLSPLSGLSSLEILHLDGTKVTDLTPLST
jgi:Leucine-rich repeat (LRR) protein